MDIDSPDGTPPPSTPTDGIPPWVPGFPIIAIAVGIDDGLLVGIIVRRRKQNS